MWRNFRIPCVINRLVSFFLRLPNSLTNYKTLLQNTAVEHPERLVTLETCDQSDEKTWPDQKFKTFVEFVWFFWNFFVIFLDFCELFWNFFGIFLGTFWELFWELIGICLEIFRIFFGTFWNFLGTFSELFRNILGTFWELFPLWNIYFMEMETQNIWRF